MVDDDPSFHLIIGMLLEMSEDFEVAGDARDGPTALAAAAAVQPAFILLDLTLPGTSGIELLPRLLEVSSGSQVVVMTGHDEVVMGDRVRAVGAVGYLDKGQLVDRLIPTLAELRDGY